MMSIAYVTNLDVRLTCEPKSTDDPVLLLVGDVEIALGNWQGIVDSHGFEEGTGHEDAGDNDQEDVKLSEPLKTRQESA